MTNFTAFPPAVPGLWKGPRLLVPVNVEALVVSSPSLNLPWSLNSMQYSNAGAFMNVRPTLFEQQGSPKTGVTLHWALPDGTTHGTAGQNGDIVYPYVPNRWLVTRYYNAVSTSWVLQSDYLDLTNGQNQFLDPAQPTPALTRIGKIWKAEEWPGEQGVAQQQFLHAIGPGLPAFTAYTPNINGVFSFYDDMTEIANQATPVTYQVIGWYASPADDPLYGKNKYGDQGFSTLEEWQSLMNDLQWTVGDDNDLQKAENDWLAWAKQNNIPIDPADIKDLYPAQTLCYGMVYNVNWLGQTGKLQSGVPQYSSDTPAQERPLIAVGNTAVDALAALVEYELNLKGTDGSAAAELLEAFNYNLLADYEKQGGQFDLYREIFDNWFAGSDGEVFWYIENTDSAAAAVIQPPVLSTLVLLNQEALVLKKKQNILLAAQQNLYGNWWKTGKADSLWGQVPQGVTPQQWAQILADLKKALPANQDEVDALQKEIDSLVASVANLKAEVSRQLLIGQELKQNIGNRYYEPNDPVILIYGAHRSYRHGEDGRYDDSDMLLTRFTGQFITGIAVNIEVSGKDFPVVNAGNITIPAPVVPYQLLPKELPGLTVENFFLNTLQAEPIAVEACRLLSIPFEPGYTAVVQKQQTSAWNADIYGLDRQLITDAAGLIGTLPSRVAIVPWAAPWSPLYMAWEITWYPSYTQPSEALKCWQFDETILEYEWDNRFSPSGNSVTFTGSALITPKSAFAMQAKLEKYLDSTGKFPDLKDFLETVGNWDFLTQNLSGLANTMASFNASQLNIPPEPIRSQVGSATQLCPVPDETMGFYPIRAGHFQISKLWVIDDFGQVFDPISAVGQTPGSYHPAIGTGLITAGNANLVQLPPRFNQPARLEFSFVNAEEPADRLQINQQADPVCGWLLPNHLDHGLSVYDQKGNLLGELLLAGDQNTQQLRWDTAPGINTPVGAPLDEVIANPFLRSFVQQLLDRPDSPSAFKDFLYIIDETMWAIEPLGGRRNELVSVFIGRPLALVRTSMQYEPAGGLLYNQSWLDSTKDNSDAYETVPFPVQIGCLQNPQDGTLGYFLPAFDTFNTVYASPPVPVSDYIGHQPVTLSLQNKAQEVFVLVDPRGEINAISGILPVEVKVLPGTLVEDALVNMAVTFRTGPLITEPDKLRMPLPSQLSGSWSWVLHSGVTTWEEISQIGQANDKARFDDGYQFQDGWLKLTNGVDTK